jgi:5-formyltetrahydrofolate cyclo-ligase
MTAPIVKSKSVLREQIRTKFRTIPVSEREAKASQACSLLEQQSVWQNAQSILFFAPLPGEIDIWPLLQDSLAAKKTVALPRFDSVAQKYVACQIQNEAADLRLGQFGIREPTTHCVMSPIKPLDLILVPGVAFDLHGRRLGRGKGFYDRLLADMRGTTCGVAFDEQIVAEIPVEPHDVHLDYLLTPTRWIEP